MSEMILSTVECQYCGNPTIMHSTCLCDNCWLLKSRIDRNPGLARKMLGNDPHYSRALDEIYALRGFLAWTICGLEYVLIFKGLPKTVRERLEKKVWQIMGILKTGSCFRLMGDSGVSSQDHLKHVGVANTLTRAEWEKAVEGNDGKGNGDQDAQ